MFLKVLDAEWNGEKRGMRGSDDKARGLLLHLFAKILPDATVVGINSFPCPLKYLFSTAVAKLQSLTQFPPQSLSFCPLLSPFLCIVLFSIPPWVISTAGNPDIRPSNILEAAGGLSVCLVLPLSLVRILVFMRWAHINTSTRPHR